MKSLEELDPITVTALRGINELTDSKNVPFMIVGAAARDILLNTMHGIDTGRATKDFDLAFLISNWDEYENLRSGLLSLGNFSETKNYLKLKYDNVLEIDFVPFGPIANADHSLALPPDWNFVLDITGFQEAYDTASLIDIADNISVKIITVSALAVLKVFAWKDRRQKTNKDAHDLRIIIKHYLNLDNGERFFNQYQKLYETDNFDYEQASAWLIGHDIQSSFLPKSKDKLIKIIDYITRDERDNSETVLLAASMQGTTNIPSESYEKYVQLLMNMKNGIQGKEPTYMKD